MNLTKHLKIMIKHLLQILFILSPLLLLLPSFNVDYEALMATTYIGQNANFNNIWLHIIYSRGNLAIAITLSVFLFFKIRDINSKELLNKGNLYYDMPYWWFWFYAKIMGYSEVNLKLVPIYMQIKLVLNDMFKNWKIGEHPEDEKSDIKRTIYNGKVKSNTTVNFIISDTYPIQLKQIPNNIRGNYSIMISRQNKEFRREYNKDFIFKINEEIRTLPSHIKRVNCFMTTNTMHNFHITNDIFKNGDRGNIESLYVYQQERAEPRNFEKKGKKIY